MQLQTNLNLKLQQTLKITPRMLQSIEILQLPITKLEEYINNELVSNPALEITENSTEIKQNLQEDKEKSLRKDEGDFSAVDELSKDDMWDDAFDTPKGPKSSNEEYGKMEAIENTAEIKETLKDYLTEQMQFLDLSPEEKKTLEFLIENIEDSGYIGTNYEELKKIAPVKVDNDIWEAMVRTLKEMDPPGVGAQNLQETLLLQLYFNGGDNRIEEMLIKEHLDDILHNRIPQIAKATKMSQAEIVASVEAIATLKPKPGIYFTPSETNNQAIPDVIVSLIEGDDGTRHYVVSLREETLPNIRINDYYASVLPTIKENKKDFNYLKEKIDSGQNLISALEQRRDTIKKIATYIVQEQQEFLEHGIEKLRPMKMQDVADAIGRHLATVGRAISGKYIQTPRGILPFKFFFSAGLNSTAKSISKGNTTESNKAVMQKIKQLIDSEDKSRPFSDQEIANILKKQGTSIARRTVSKYREAMNIASTRQRKVYK